MARPPSPAVVADRAGEAEGGVRPLFDVRLQPEGLSGADLETMRFFGLSAAVVTAQAQPRATAASLREHFDELVQRQLPRLAAAGVRGYAALGVHPQAVPRRGLSEVLSALPSYFTAGKVVALGAIGLHQGGEAEAEAFSEQLQLARRLKLPVVVTTPRRDKERITKRALRMLGESGLPPQRVLVDRANAATLPLVLECGYWAALAVHPDELTAEAVVALIRRRGAQRLMVSSGAGGAGAGDILALARLVSLLGKGHLSPQLIAKVAHENAAEFFRVPVPTWSP
jgi:uncharacterized protein